MLLLLQQNTANTDREGPKQKLKCVKADSVQGTHTPKELFYAGFAVCLV